MKTIRPFVLAALLSLAQFAFAATTDVDQKIQALRTEVDKYLASLPKAADQRARSGNDGGPYIQEQLSRIAAFLKQDNPENAEQLVRQLSQQIPTPAVTSLTAELLIEIKNARDLRDSAWVENTEAFVKRASAQILAAKAEKDLDGLLEESSSLRIAANNHGNQNDRLQRAAQKLESLIYLVRRWQDYLAQLNAGNGAAARQVMQELANDSRYPIIQRSELLARLTAAPSPQQPAQEMSKPELHYTLEVGALDTLPAALDKMRVHFGNAMPPDISSLYQSLSSLVAADAAVEAGNLQPAFQAFLQGTASGSAIPETTRSLFLSLLRSLMLKVLPRFLDVTPELAPKADENPSDYCLRIARAGRDTADWRLVARALEGYERVSFSNLTGSTVSPAWLSSDRQALANYLIGLNQEKAEEVENAMQSYIRTLNSQGTFVPINDISARIIRLRKLIEDRRTAEHQKQLDEQQRQIEISRRKAQQNQPKP